MQSQTTWGLNPGSATNLPSMCLGKGTFPVLNFLIYKKGKIMIVSASQSLLRELGELTHVKDLEQS